MKAVTFQIELLEPLLAASLDGDPNSGVSYSFIPGSAVRGAVIGRYIVERKPGVVEGANGLELELTPEVRRLFFDGTTRYLNAYLTSSKGKRALPVPLSWQRKKGAEKSDPIYDQAHPDFEDDLLEDDEVEQPKSVDGGFYQLHGEEEVELCTIEQQLHIHTQRDRQAGRATPDGGEVFNYQGLAAGQLFRGAILCDHDADADTLRELLAGEASMGRSKQAGYGRVLVTVDDKTQWPEVDTRPKEIKAGDTLTLTLHSDLIIRDGWGQYTDILAPAVVSKALGLAEDALEAGKTFKGSTLVGGFNRKWGLPLPQTIAIKAGSVFQFQAKTNIPADKLQRLAERGLGERRAEGFGQVVVNWFPWEKAKLAVFERGKPVPPDEPAPLTGDSQRLAQMMATRLLRREIDRLLGKTINEYTMSSPPKKSQLGGLRVVIQRARTAGSFSPVLEYLGLDKQSEEDEKQKSTGMKKTGRQQFESAWVERGGERERLRNWLTDLLKTPSKVWSVISFDLDKNPAIGSAKSKVDEQLAIEYTLRLMDGVLAKAAKEKEGD
jgi:CRISPR-associated protein Csx10